VRDGGQGCGSADDDPVLCPCLQQLAARHGCLLAMPGPPRRIMLLLAEIIFPVYLGDQHCVGALVPPGSMCT
jgi:hypothetical protein